MGVSAIVRFLILAVAGPAITRVVLLAPGVKGHAYLLGPTSRQVWYGPAFQGWDFENIEYCPSCYNAAGPEKVRARAESLTDPTILAEYGGGSFPLLFAMQKGEVAANGNYLERDELAVRHGVCGDPEQREGEDFNRYSTPSKDWPIFETYQQGGAIELKVVMNAFHWGHIEFFICNIEDQISRDGVPFQSCFNKHPLTRSAGDDVNSPIDPNYPGRYYVDPKCRESETDQTKPEGMDYGAASGYVMTMNYDLPEALHCVHCVLQMVYYTGNHCKHIGYDEFNPPSWPGQCGPDKSDWIMLNRSICGEEDGYPEEFWACADIKITADGSVPAPTPTATNPPLKSTPEPVEDAPRLVKPTPEPAEPIPEPVEPTPEPEERTPEPVEPTREPIEPTPEPVEPTPEPAEPTTEPVASPMAAPVVQPSVGTPVGVPVAVPVAIPVAVPVGVPVAVPVAVDEEPFSDEIDNGGEQDDDETSYRSDTLSTFDPLDDTPTPGPYAVPSPKRIEPTAVPASGTCSEEVMPYEQCGGEDYTGSSICCQAGYECSVRKACYSQCRPIET